MDRAGTIAGALLGGAVGDALGLPREGPSRRRSLLIFGDGDVAHRFACGRGMISDDTEHACMTAQALLAAPDDAAAFGRSLAWRLRCWLLGLPAGVGLATLRAVLKLWVGFSPERSGVRSAGNGPAMRAAIVGTCLAYRPEQLRQNMRVSTRLTHTDARAEEGALVVAIAAAGAARKASEPLDPHETLAEIREHLTNEELIEALDGVAAGLERGLSAAEFAGSLGLAQGVSGYICHTVPAALFCWLRWPNDFRAAVSNVIRLGGDTDSTAALVGALAGASGGPDCIPAAWLDGLLEWPRSVRWMRRLAAALATQFEDAKPREFEASRRATAPVPLFWPGLPFRNLAFAAIVLAHGVRRLLPPY